MKRFVYVVMAVICCCANCGAVAAAVQTQLDVPGIGSELPFENISFSIVNYQSTGSGTSKTANVSDLVITRQLDAASPQLLQAAVNGDFFNEVEIHFCTDVCNPATKYMTYKLSDAIISSYQTGIGDGGLPTEDVSFNYAKMTMSYFPTPLPPRTAWGAILPTSLPVGGMEPYQFDFVLDGTTVAALFDRPLSPLGDGLPPTLLHVGVPEPGTVWLLATGSLAVFAGRRRRR